MASHAHEFYTDFNVSDSGTYFEDIIDYMVSLDFLSSESLSTFVCIFRVMRWLLKNYLALLVLEHVEMARSGTKMFGGTHVPNSIMYSSTEADV